MPASITTNPFRTLGQKMSGQKNDEDHMSLLDRPEVRQQRRRGTAGVATLDGMSDRFAQLMQRYNVHYGWGGGSALFLTMLATAGVLGSAGVMIEPLQAEFGWSNADI